MLNRRDSTLLEQRLFEKTNLEPDLHEKIEQIYRMRMYETKPNINCILSPPLVDAVDIIVQYFFGVIFKRHISDFLCTTPVWDILLVVR